MRWRSKHQRHQSPPPPSSPPPPTSTSFLASVLPSSWITKIKKMAGKPKQSSMPKPTSRSPPAPEQSAAVHVVDAPRRLSVGEDDTLLARARTSHARSIPRSARHNSFGGDLEWRPDFDLTNSLSRPRNLTTTITSESDLSESDPTLILRHRRPPRWRSRRPITTAVGGLPGEPAAALPLLPPIVTGKTRKSFSRKARRRSCKPKVRVCSPRPSTVSRAEVYGAQRRVARGGGLEGFAVVKSSCDPQRDFRESMVEMICERGIGRPEELEGLLACYLSLNSDEHHDVIVKVFRQLWFDLNPAHLVCSPRFS